MLIYNSAGYTPHRIQAIKEMRDVTPLDLRSCLILLAEIFGFKVESTDADPQADYNGWRQFVKWQDENQISLESAKGPHVLTILKAIAAKHGRNVSTGQ